MALPGQASGDFTESSSALRILHLGVRNAVGAQLTTDGFTQLNPPIETDHVTETLPRAPKRGVLAGSVCFTRPDAGNGFVGGPPEGITDGIRPLGLFVSDAAGNAYENSPAVASGQAPYVSSGGTYGTQLFETRDLGNGDELAYAPGDLLYASRNGYLTNNAGDALEQADPTIIGVVKIAPDSIHAELVFDLRI